MQIFEQPRGKYYRNFFLGIPRRDYENKKDRMVEEKKTKIPNLGMKKFNQILLSDSTKSIILGSILGDGCLRFPSDKNRNVTFSFRHSSVQSEYFWWKVENINEISRISSTREQKPDGFSKNAKLHYESKCLPELTEIYEILKKNKKLVIKRKWLNYLTPLSLAIWWCDDGSLICNNRKGVICTDGFDKEYVILLVKYLEVVWGIKAKVGSIKRKKTILNNYSKEEYFRIWFGTEELKKFLRIILPYIPVKSMIYKTLLIYKDSEFQQRWTSEVKNLINVNFVEFVDEEILKKKNKMKFFKLKSEDDIVPLRE